MKGIGLQLNSKGDVTNEVANPKCNLNCLTNVIWNKPELMYAFQFLLMNSLLAELVSQSDKLLLYMN